MFNLLSALKKIVVPAALAGLLAGVLLSVIQHLQVVPLILQAEVYEQAAEAANPTAANLHAHDAQPAWQPQEGWQRNIFTAAANIVVAFGFALLLAAVVTLRGVNLNWRSGLLWGLAGYVIFFLAPSLGLPPEVPGAQAAELVYRQAWWMATSICTAAALALMFFSAQPVVKLLGAVLLLAPHLLGAPQPDSHGGIGGVAPSELAQQFISAAFIANAVFWLGLGGLYGFFQRRQAV